MSDAELFRPGFEAFCRSFAEAAAGRAGVRSAKVCLASGSCRLEFEGGSLGAPEMAAHFRGAVDRAIARAIADGPPAGRQPDWTSLTVFSPASGGSTWETTRERPGALRLRHRALLEDGRLARRVAEGLDRSPGVESGWVTAWTRELEVRFDPEKVSPTAALLAAEGAYRHALQPASGRPESIAGGARRLWYLTLAAGALGLTVIGLVVPGVPTPPLLLLTSYYLARSSPAMNRRLLRSPFLGPILVDLEEGRGLHRINKIRLVGFTIAIGLVTIIVAGPTLPVLLVMSAAMAASFYAVSRMPSLPDASGPSPRALPAPA